MKKKKLSLFLLPMLLIGCATGKWQNVSYLTPSSKAIPGVNPKVYLNLRTIEGLKFSENVASTLKKGMAGRGGLAFSDIPKSDFIICLDLFFTYSKDSSESIPYNTEISVTDVKRSSGGQQKIQRIGKKTAIGVLVANVSLYRTNDLEPITYFTITTYNTSKVSSASKLRTEESFALELCKQIVAKIKNLMVTDYRKIPTYLPNNADKEILSAFNQSDYKNIKSEIIQHIQIPTLQGLQKTFINKKSYFEEDPDAKESLLSNYYIYLLSKERKDISPENIKDLYTSYLFLLGKTENEGLVIACTNSLGRIENKCERLSINLY